MFLSILIFAKKASPKNVILYIHNDKHRRKIVMTMDEINKRYEELKYTKTCIERAMEKFRGTNNIDNYLSLSLIHI